MWFVSGIIFTRYYIELIVSSLIDSLPDLFRYQLYLINVWKFQSNLFKRIYVTGEINFPEIFF